MATALQIGAGNIGRGFLGELFFRSGFRITFVDTNTSLVDALNRRGGFELTIVADPDQPAEAREVLHVGGVSALHPGQKDRFREAFAECALLGVSVGVANVPAVADLIADGVSHRLRAGGGPLNGLVCENLMGSGRYLKELVLERVPARERDAVTGSLGLAEAVVARMVPLVTDEDRRRDPLYLAVERYNVLPVDGRAFVGEPPQVYHVEPIDNIEAYQARKLYAFNAAHAILAYVGYQRGLRYVWQAVEDVQVRALAERALGESLQALSLKFDWPLEELWEHALGFVTRFGNRNLGDTVQRVARDPLRKLGPKERLIGSARLALEHGIEPEGLVAGVVAALRHDEPTDAQAQKLQRMLRDQGLESVLRQVCQLQPGQHLEQLITRAYSGSSPS